MAGKGAEKTAAKGKPSLHLNLAAVTEDEKSFLLKFFLSFALLFAAVLALPLAPLLEWIAGTEAAWLSSAGVDAFAQGTVVHAGGIEFEIVNECSSLVMIALLAALLIAGGKKSDYRALAIGAPFLFAFNLLRLFATMVVGAKLGEGTMDGAHYFLWLVDSALVLGIWFEFGRKREQEEEKKEETKGEGKV